MSLQSEALSLCPHLRKDAPLVYILLLQSGKYYVGSTADFSLRFEDHQSECGCRTTRRDPPQRLVWIEIQTDFYSAIRREAQLKKWSHAKKTALIESDFLRLKELSKSRETENTGNFLFLGTV